jgi:hypothetical protein
MPANDIPVFITQFDTFAEDFKVSTQVARELRYNCFMN